MGPLFVSLTSISQSAARLRDPHGGFSRSDLRPGPSLRSLRDPRIR